VAPAEDVQGPRDVNVCCCVGDARGQPDGVAGPAQYMHRAAVAAAVAEGQQRQQHKGVSSASVRRVGKGVPAAAHDAEWSGDNRGQ
jgi:hypothetical protein